MNNNYLTPIGSNFKLEAIFDSDLKRLKLRANFAVYCKHLARQKYACIIVVKATGKVLYRNLIAKYETGSNWVYYDMPDYPDLIKLQSL